MLEREIKLRFSSAQDAREAVLALGAAPVRGRRFQTTRSSTTSVRNCASGAARCACAARTHAAT